VGAQKSGTTALAAYLRSHPEIYMFGDQSGRRSAHYFSNENIDFRNKQQYDDYHALFSPQATCTGIMLFAGFGSTTQT